MISAVLDHLWQSTLVALAAALLALAFRRARASVRYGLWFTASAKFLVPFAALGALGRLLAPAVRPPTGAVLIARAAEPFSPSRSPAPTAHGILDPTMLVAGLWALGSVAVLAFWLARWMRVRATVRGAAPLAVPAPMVVLGSPRMLEPGLVGLWRPVLLVPDALFEHLDGPELDALIAHETCHLRRRDNLTAAIHMLVEALFWFHPIVWWIGGRLIAERERACDEAVVGAGHDREAYARGLIECCRLYLQSPLPCVAGASGSDLPRRVETIMTAPVSSPLSRAGKGVLIAAGVCAVASPVAAGWLTSPQGREVVARVAAVQAHDEPARPVTQAPNRSSPAPVQALAEQDATPVDAAPEGPSSQPVAIEAASQLSLNPAAQAEVARASLTPVSAQMSEEGQPLGPGHYVERSGLKGSGGCGMGRYSDDYRISTRPISPGHVITNFHYDLVGDNRCKPKWQSGQTSAQCEIVTDRPDRKTVQFQLLPNGDYCFGYTAFPQDGSHHDNEASGTVSQSGAVTRSEMVLSYDVQ